MQINTNVFALSAQRNLSSTATSMSKSVERLSSGMRINRAADDAAGLAVSEKLRAQVRGIAQAGRNAQDGISMIQTAEGALTEVHSIMQRMRELGVQASNDTLSTEDRDAVNTELQQLAAEVNNIGDTSRFNGKNLLTGSLSTTLGGATATDLVVGDTVTTTGGNATTTAIDVKAARPGETYTMTFSGTNLTMTRASDSVAQTLSVSALAANASGNLNFSQLGVSITLQADSGGKTALGIATDLGTAGANDTIVTAAGTGGANFQIGANASDAVSVTFAEVRLNGSVGGNLSALNTALGNFNTTKDVTNAKALITAVDNAINTVNDRRSVLGAAQNRLEHTINNLAVANENLTASESRIRDADMAKEMAQFTRNQILQQAGTAILAQANQIPQGVLSLLR